MLMVTVLKAITCISLLDSAFFFFPEISTRGLFLRGKCSTTTATPAALFASVIFQPEFRAFSQFRLLIFLPMPPV
jgi:hypothetical protein